MNPVAGYSLWVGHRGDLDQIATLQRRGVRAIVDLALEELPPSPPRGLVFVRVPLNDGGGNDRAMLRLAIEVIASMIHTSTATLICCSAGMSRSPALAAAAIALASRHGISETLSELASSMPVDVSPALWREVIAAMPPDLSSMS